jgi:hypothetical protein
MNTLLVILTTCSCCLEQPDSLSQYGAAIEWVSHSDVANEFMHARDTNLSMVVSDSIVPLEMTSFFVELGRGMISQGKKALLDSLSHLDMSLQSDTTKMPDIGSLRSNTNGRFVLFFSKSFGNALIAELFYNPHEYHSYKAVTRFNQSLMFLFEFDKSNHIAKVTITSPQYE